MNLMELPRPVRARVIAYVDEQRQKAVDTASTEIKRRQTAVQDRDRLMAELNEVNAQKRELRREIDMLRIEHEELELYNDHLAQMASQEGVSFLAWPVFLQRLHKKRQEEKEAEEREEVDCRDLPF